MPLNTIRLPNGKRCTVSRYVTAWRTIKTLAPDTSLPGFDHFPAPAASILDAMRYGLHDRINKHDPAYGHGRKWANDWQRHTLQAAHALNTPRLVIDWLPIEFKERFAHRLRSHD